MLKSICFSFFFFFFDFDRFIYALCPPCSCKATPSSIVVSQSNALCLRLCVCVRCVFFTISKKCTVSATPLKCCQHHHFIVAIYFVRCVQRKQKNASRLSSKGREKIQNFTRNRKLLISIELFGARIKCHGIKELHLQNGSKTLCDYNNVDSDGDSSNKFTK